MELKDMIVDLQNQLKTAMESKASVEVINEIKGRLDEIETKSNRAPAATQDTKNSEVKASFNKYARTGEVKAIATSTDAGGYITVPEVVTNEMMKNQVIVSDIRTSAKVRTTGTDKLILPAKSGNTTAGWGKVVQDTQGTFGVDKIEIPVFDMYAKVDVDMATLEDAYFNLEQELGDDFNDQFKKTEGIAFIKGNGTSAPEGIMVNASVVAVASGVADKITIDGLMDLSDALPGSAYDVNAKFFLNKKTLNAIKKLKDGNGNYIYLQGNIQTGTPATILGKEYVICADMDDIGANKYPVAYGDLAQAYAIVDRIGMQMLRDNYTQASAGQIRFIARKRVGGKVVLPEAVAKLKIAASV